MINYLAELKRISIRIKSNFDSCSLFYNTFGTSFSNDNNASKIYFEENVEIYKRLEEFYKNFELVISPEISELLHDFFEKNNVQFFSSNSNPNGLKRTTVLLSSLESKITYYLGDPQAHIRKTMEIAFAHLQRSIVVDETLRKRWQDANGEVRCEKLGGVHLLLHKIWAFKSNADGERTDLILSEPDNILVIDTKDPLYKSVDGLVLTEWKYVRNSSTLTEYNTLKEDAKKQALRYKFGSLYPLELSKYCYLVIVSEKHLGDKNEEIQEGGITFRVINIAHTPGNPCEHLKKQNESKIG